MQRDMEGRKGREGEGPPSQWDGWKKKDSSVCCEYKIYDNDDDDDDDD